MGMPGVPGQQQMGGVRPAQGQRVNPGAPAQTATGARPAGQGPAPAPPAAGRVNQTREQFSSALVTATPEQRKHMIGERLYALIATRQPEGVRAGKITGMLLEGMDDSELLHLLETPAELDSRIREAIDVLDQHKRGAQ